MAAQWQNFNPLDLVDDEIQDVVTFCMDTAETLGESLQFLADAVGIAATFTQDLVDINKLIIEETQELIYAVVQALTQTGVYWTWYMPPSFTQKVPPSKWLSDMAKSFDDVMDPDRPMLPTRAFVGAVCVVVTGRSWNELFKLFREFFALFRKVIAQEVQTDGWGTLGDPFVVIPGVGKEPNWGSMTLLDVIPPIGDIVRLLLGFADQITAARSGLLETFADFLSDKADVLLSLSDKFQQILDELESLLQFEGAWILPIYGEFDSGDIQNILQHTEGGPEDLSGMDYTAGVMLLSNGGTTGGEAVDPVIAAGNLLTLFGLPLDLTVLPEESL